jgi:hypothetical protein
MVMKGSKFAGNYNEQWYCKPRDMHAIKNYIKAISCEVPPDNEIFALDTQTLKKQFFPLRDALRLFLVNYIVTDNTECGRKT